MARRLSARAICLIALSCAAVVSTLLVASVATSSLLGTKRTPPDAFDPNPGKGTFHRERLDAPAIPEWLSTTLLVLLMIGIIGLVWFVKIAQRRPPDRLQYEEDPGPSVGDWDALIVAELGEAAVVELNRLREGEPRNAIVACWKHLQDTTATAGVPAHECETSTEFTVRVLRRLALDEAAISTLSALYREARFSTHEMGEPARAEAIEAVGVLADQLTQRETRSGFTPRPRAALDSVTP